MVAVATSVFQRNGGRWCAQYKHDGKHKQVSAKTKDEVVKKRQAIIDALNHQISSASEQENLMLESKSETEETQHHELLVCEKNDDEEAIRPNEKHENAINRITLGNWLFEWLELYAK